MRNNGKVYLPITVSKNALIHDLQYYGFNDGITINPSLIMNDSTNVLFPMAVARIWNQVKKTRQVRQQIKQMDYDHGLEEIAL